MTASGTKLYKPYLNANQKTLVPTLDLSIVIPVDNSTSLSVRITLIVDRQNSINKQTNTTEAIIADAVEGQPIKMPLVNSMTATTAVVTIANPKPPYNRNMPIENSI